MNLSIRSALAAAGLAALVFAAPAFAQETVTVTHAQGETEVPVNPETVITFDIAALDTLDALGVEVDGVPEFNMPANLEKYNSDDYAKLGSLFEPDYEAVNAARPDLIIVAGRSSGAYEELSKIAPTIDLTNDWADFTGSIKQHTRSLGTIFEKTAQTDAMIAEYDEKAAQFGANAETIGNALIVLTSGGEVSAYGPGSRFGFVHDSLGVIPAIEDVEAATHGEAVSFEFLLETNPDWLIVLDRDAAVGQGSEAARQTLDNELVHQMSAHQNQQIVYVDAARWYITNGGMDNLNTIVDELSAAMLAE